MALMNSAVVFSLGMLRSMSHPPAEGNQSSLILHNNCITQHAHNCERPNHKCSRLIVCRGLLRFEFFHRGVEIGRSVMRATDGFDMTAVAERAAVVQAGSCDDVVHVVDKL